MNEMSLAALGIRPTRDMRERRRLLSSTVTMMLGGNPGHVIDVSLAVDLHGELWELAFVGRGKIGADLDLMLHDLGVATSRMMQGRDPASGEPIPEPSPRSEATIKLVLSHRVMGLAIKLHWLPDGRVGGVEYSGISADTEPSLLRELGAKTTEALQGRHPETGAALHGDAA
ncbi:MAG: hypothetical protein JWO51_165 [Rhodospirillales bacterium]|nr:hypothetical protein [Rhodospirillales bacterium]